MSIKARAKATYSDVGNKDILSESPPLPRTMMIETTNACNHACLFCPSAVMSRKKRLIDTDLCKRIILDAADNGIQEIGFYTTGEPFLHKGLSELVAYAKGLSVGYLFLSTNGALATPERYQSLLEAGIDSIKFSINAGSRDTYRQIHGKDDWDQVISNLQSLSDFRKRLFPAVKLYVTCSETPMMSHEVPMLLDMLSPLVDEVSVFKAQPLAAPDADTNEGARICTLPFNRLHVSCEGFLSACCVDYENYLSYADLSKVSLREAWNNSAIRKLRNMHLAGSLSGVSCAPCLKLPTGPVHPLVEEFAERVDYSRFVSDQIERFGVFATANIYRDRS
jgi:sulfatase maturation enzyme AslB (radical SAM superfamily)